MAGHSRPRWVTVAIVVAAVAAIVAGVMIASGGEHGPGRHVPGHSPVDHGG